MPRAIVFAALDADELGTTFVTNINLVSVPAPAGIDDLSELTADLLAEVEASTDAELRGEAEQVALPAGDAIRAEFRLGALDVVQLYILDGSTVWTLTLNSMELDEHEATFDAVAATFALGPPDTDPASGHVVAPDASFAIDVPTPWLAAFPDPDGSSFGYEFRPGDPNGASLLTPTFDVITSDLTRMVVVDGDKLDRGVEGLVFDGITDLDPSLLGFDTIVEMSKPQAPGQGTVLAEGRLAGGASEIAWFQQGFSTDFSQIVYVVVWGDAVWHVTYWAEDVMARKAETDAIVQSFVPS